MIIQNKAWVGLLSGKPERIGRIQTSLKKGLGTRFKFVHSKQHRRSTQIDKEALRRPLHIALAVFQALDNEGDVPLFQEVHHFSTIASNSEYSLEAHIF